MVPRECPRRVLASFPLRPLRLVREAVSEELTEPEFELVALFLKALALWPELRSHAAYFTGLSRSEPLVWSWSLP